MPSRLPQLVGQAVFAANGIARTTLGPVPWGQRWRLSSVSVASTSTLITSATLYRSIETDTSRVDITQRRGNGATTDTVIDLQPGESLIVVWAGGTPGARATVTADGDQLV